MLIKSLEFKSGPPRNLGRITALVGPTNVGKSTALVDILRLMINRDPSGCHGRMTPPSYWTQNDMK